MPQPAQTLDGYHLIRIIGSGGFGDVWLCQVESTAEYRALKFLSQDRVRHLDRELDALKTYRSTIMHASRGGLVAIEHVNRVEDGLFYVMPLADGPPDLSPEDEAWTPVTLETTIEARRSAPWFSIEQIAGIFTPLAMALQTLSDAGLVHRDIKPQNILFFGGEPQIADIGLVTADEAELSRLGTAGYLAPQWYIDSKGNPDMWGFAATLYHCATGNHPDYMSKSSYRWPPAGKETMTGGEQKRWLALIAIVYRATRQEPTERFLQFHDLADAISGLVPTAPVYSRRRSTFPGTVLTAAVLLLALIGAAFAWHLYHLGRLQPLQVMANQSPVVSEPMQASAQPSPQSTTRPSAIGSTPSSPVASDFDKKTDTAVTDFHAFLKEARSEILGNGPPVRDGDVKFRAILKNLDTQTLAPMEVLNKTISDLEDLAPKVSNELRPIDNTKLQADVGKLYTAANLPKELAGDAEEGFRGGRKADDLLGEALAFQNEADERNTSILTEAGMLRDAVANATDKLIDRRLKEKYSGDLTPAASTERDQLYRMRDDLLAKLPNL